MLSRIRGKLVLKESDRAEILTPGGVTYEVQIPATVFGELPGPGAEVELHTALLAREDGLDLFGFRGELERRLFLRLMSASGVGPRLALALMSTLSAGELVDAIRGRDLVRLQTVSGVGRKKAERLSLELGDKLDDLVAVTAAAEPDVALVEPAVSALLALGYTRAEAETAVRNVLRDRGGSGRDVESVVREALAGMS